VSAVMVMSRVPILTSRDEMDKPRGRIGYSRLGEEHAER
jgi:hypothetical protein